MKKLMILMTLMLSMNVAQASTEVGSLPPEIKAKMLETIHNSCPEFNQQGASYVDGLTFVRQDIQDQNIVDHYYSTTFFSSSDGMIYEEFLVEAVRRGGHYSHDLKALEVKVIGCR